jgi:hypothetical protein
MKYEPTKNAKLGQDTGPAHGRWRGGNRTNKFALSEPPPAGYVAEPHLRRRRNHAKLTAQANRYYSQDRTVKNKIGNFKKN